MSDFLWYVFDPNPGRVTYATPSMIALLVACGGLVAASFAVRVWRSKIQGAVTKKLTRAWSPVLFWFGVTGLILAVCRIERIQFLAMRFLWVLWALAALLFVVLQLKLFRARHYEVLPRVAASDPRAKYLPGRKRR